MIKKILLAAFFVLASVIFVGCNTMQGVGEDFQAAGKGIENAATPSK